MLSNSVWGREPPSTRYNAKPHRSLAEPHSPAQLRQITTNKAAIRDAVSQALESTDGNFLRSFLDKVGLGG